MAPVIFTDREMRRAWEINLKVYTHLKTTNAHRLLLFYAVECGLKAVLMKRRQVNCTELCGEIQEAQHNINKLLDCLSAGEVLKLPSQLQMQPIKIQGETRERTLDPGKINQVWRYGGSFVHIHSSSSASSDVQNENIEKQLNLISEWIKQELGA